VLPDEEFTKLADPFRAELLRHCYRMVGSAHDAEDLVQETYLRAWRAYAEFEGRSSLRTWLYRIATRVCLTALDSRARRVLPSGLGTSTDDGAAVLGERRWEVPWLEPLPDDDGASPHDPAAIIGRRESVRLAFVAALQRLPARQRAALVLRDVMAWPASDVAELLEMSTAAVNSALQRARAELHRATPSEEMLTVPVDIDTALLERYVTAFENADIGALAAMFHEDVQLEMPPIPTWFAGRDAVVTFYGDRIFRTLVRRVLVPIRANGCPAAATYVLHDDGRLHAHSVQVLEVEDGRIVHLYAFLDTTLFALFGLPLERDAG
jgi:RNA polymerase sigma-70 factor, ECF subfamily